LTFLRLLLLALMAPSDVALRSAASPAPSRRLPAINLGCRPRLDALRSASI
jgi:hypothetical protein